MAEGSFLNPYCHLVIKAIRNDSPLLGSKKVEFCKLLLQKRLDTGFTQSEFAKRLGVSIRTLKNWEHNRNKPSRSVWAHVKPLLNPVSPLHKSR